jgi:hypothetical protein
VLDEQVTSMTVVFPDDVLQPIDEASYLIGER